MTHIPYEERAKVYQEALNINGTDTQLVVAIEELSEVQKELCKAIRGDVHPAHVAEEVADAIICLEQVMRIFGIRDSVDRMMDAKIIRLRNKLYESKIKNSGCTELRRLHNMLDDKEESGLWTDFP